MDYFKLNLTTNTVTISALNSDWVYFFDSKFEPITAVTLQDGRYLLPNEFIGQIVYYKIIKLSYAGTELNTIISNITEIVRDLNLVRKD